MYAITSPVPQFFDLSGDPLDAGKIYIGTAGSNPITSPVAVYWDDAGTQPAAQPIRTVSGYPARNGKPARVYVGADDFSMTVMTRADVLVTTEISVLSSATLRVDLADDADTAKGADLIGYRGRTVFDRLDDQINVKDYGATGDGVTDDTAAIQAAINAVPLSSGGASGQGGYVVCFPTGKYKITATLVCGMRRLAFMGLGGGIIGSNGTMIFTANPNIDIIDYSTGSLDTFSMYNLQLRGAGKGTGTGNGIVLGRAAGQTAFDCQLERCWIVGMPAAGVVLQNAVNYQIQQGAIELCGTGLIVKQSLSGSGDNNQVASVTFYGNDTGIFVDGGTGLIITDNVFWLNGVGAGTVGDDVTGAIVIDTASGSTVRGVTIDGNSYRANTNDIIIDGHNGSNAANTGVNDVLISASQSQLPYRRFALIKGANNVHIVSNKINGASQETHNTFDAIEITGTSDRCFVDGTHVTNNNAARRQRYGLNLGASTTRTGLGLNHFEGATAPYNRAAGSTLDNAANLSGTWTPVLKGSGTAGTQTYSQQAGTWQRIGNMVFVTGKVYLSALDGATSGSILVDGLPFTCAETINVSIGSWGGVTAAGDTVTARVTPTLSYISLLRCGVAGAGPAPILVGAISSSFSIEFSATYAAS